LERIIVTAAIIKDNGRYLIAQRKKDSHLGLKWEFPGGKLEVAEDPEKCLAREIKEELDITIEVIDIFEVVSHSYEQKNILLLCYMCKLMKGTPKSVDCNDFKWVALSEMPKFDFAEADRPVVEKLLGF
jgi:8-oxo-dGTP diphosphatase